MADDSGARLRRLESRVKVTQGGDIRVCGDKERREWVAVHVASEGCECKVDAGGCSAEANREWERGGGEVGYVRSAGVKGMADGNTRVMLAHDEAHEPK